MVFDLDILPLSINRLYEMAPHGRHLIHSKAGKTFIEYAKGRILQQIKEKGLQQEVLSLDRTTPLRLRLDFHSSSWVTSNNEIAVRSLDNLPRAIQEALTAALKTYNGEFNDCTVVEVITRKKNSERTETVIVLEKI